jgi:transcriptional antiterminator Rof (Rho-off)
MAGGAQNIVLLVEWKGISQGEDFRKKSRKLVAREIELRVWLEGHVTVTGCYGCTAEEGEGRSLLLRLGKIHSGQHRYIALEFTLSAMPAGIHEALWLQWQYRQPPVERIRELPLKKLGIEYSHHTDVLGTGCCFHVEKHLELLKTEKLLAEAELLRTKQQIPAPSDKLRRQADKLLLLAARSGDMQLVKEAESLYKQLESKEEPRVRLITR